MEVLKKWGELWFGIVSEVFFFLSLTPGTGPILLDDLSCTGSESSLKNCSHSGIGIHDCDHGEDVILSCTESKTNSL